tara:strand:+ start:5546 stop:5866 length:321 start_codon:yes stop_codon:yes gene_type:complete
MPKVEKKKKITNYFKRDRSQFDNTEIARLDSVSKELGGMSFSDYYNSLYPSTRGGQSGLSKLFIKYPEKSSEIWINEYKQYLKLFRKEHIQKLRENMIMDSLREIQ